MRNIRTDTLITSIAFVFATFAVPFQVAAQIANKGGGGELEVLLINIMLFINDILVPFIIAIGFLFFVWGMFQYFIAGGANEEKREAGKSLMIYATLGFVLIIIFFGIVNLITSSTGLEGESVRGLPTVPVPKGP